MRGRYIVAGGSLLLVLMGCEDTVSQSEHDRAVEQLSMQVSVLQKQVQELTSESARHEVQFTLLNETMADEWPSFMQVIDDLREELEPLFALVDFADQLEGLERLLAASEDFDARLAALEIGEGHTVVNDSQEVEAAGSRPDRTMRIVRIETLPPDRSRDGEIADLRRRAEQRSAEARKLEREIANLYEVYRGWWWYYNQPQYRDRYRDRMQENRNKRRELRRQQRNLETEAKRLSGQATRIEDDANAPKQRISGECVANGIEIILQTERDFSALLARMAVGSMLSWRGRLIEQDEVSQAWSVTSISRVNDASQ
jgi:hypothetical protein